MRHIIKIFIIVCLLSSLSRAQFGFNDWGLGASGIYNFQTNGIGFGARGYFSFGDNLAIVPKFNLFPGIHLSNLANGIKESYVGLNVHYKINPWHSWHFYALFDASYNKWKNYQYFTTSRAQLRSFSMEGGIGLMRTRGCIRPFVEVDYNLKWRESNLRVGFYIFFQDCFGGVTPNGYRKGRYLCP